jgi:hypothetical protein
MTATKKKRRTSGRPPKGPTEKRTHKVNASFNDDELNLVETRAYDLGMPVAAFVRVAAVRMASEKLHGG